VLIIFDCDGVLVDSEILASQVLSRYLTGLEFNYSFDDCNSPRFMGLPLSKVKDIIEAETGRALPDDFIDHIHAADHAFFQDRLQPIDGIGAALDRIPNSKCVASSGEPEKIVNSLTLTGLLDHFGQHLYSGYQVANGKPAPDLFLHACTEMGYEAGRCVVIEDSRAGVMAGVAAGMRVLGFTGGGHCGPEMPELLRDAGADVIFGHMRKLPGLLDGLTA